MTTTKGSVQTAPSLSIDNSPFTEATESYDASLAKLGKGSVSFIQGTNSSAPTPQLEDEVTDKHGTPFETDTSESEEDSTDETDATETEESEDTEVLEGFDQEFEKRFGLPVDEARETINSLIAFKDEMALMRGWGISPADYDSRMKAVKEFFVTLPENKQAEFNSPEGAKAIWEHLDKQNQSKRSTRKAATTSTKAQKSAQLKKSDILRMPKEEYNRRLPEINQAYRKGLVIEDI
jgi:hypothetical protein